MHILQAVLLAIVEGLTEFLPVSSTGHMIITSSLMGIAQDPFTKTFTITIQFGAILSVLVLYRHKFLPAKGNFNELFAFYKRLFIAFLPAVVFGLLFKKYIDQMLENVIVVAFALFIGGIIFLLLDKWIRKAEAVGADRLESDGKALRIGMFQVLAMIPGVSRSASTIIGGLTQKLNKKAAAEFSFFLAIPTMFAATVKDLYDFYKAGVGFQSNQVQLLLLGNAVAFLVAIFAIRSFISYLTKHGFRLFGYYRIVVGGLILLLHFLGYQLAMF